ncbi:MAG: cytochrome c [Bacteroidetes bacterium]|nr:cytochrome c [Bacteroidota bacterium]MBK9402680.1 cytochrome c [Bacteroidota bacterium]MBL0096155.1 cytochrome c [Bacteroidota bacterium]
MKAQYARYTMLVFCLLFISFSMHLYTGTVCATTTENEENVAAGRLIWQNYNCQACHQLYGLGGYLGPDLSDVYSKPGKGPGYIAAMIKSGSGQMPAYAMTEEELKLLNEFLFAVDNCGNADPRSFEIGRDGMISQSMR